MKLLINGSEISFDLSEENRVKEVVSAVKDWAATRDLIITEVLVDEKTYHVDDELNLPVDSVGKIDCQIVSKADLIMSTIDEGAAYCERAITFLNLSVENGSVDSAKKEQLSAGLLWLEETLHTIFHLLTLDPADVSYMDRSVSECVKELSSLSAAIAAASDDKSLLEIISSRKGIIEIARGIFKMLYFSDNLRQIIVKGLDSPNDLVVHLEEVSEGLASQCESIERASIAFQTGKDAEGSEILQSLIDFIYRYMRICHQISPVFGVDSATIVIDDRSMENLNASIHSSLEEIVNVMENGDIISLADILEYQLKEDLFHCKGYTDLLLEIIRPRE